MGDDSGARMSFRNKQFEKFQAALASAEADVPEHIRQIHRQSLKARLQRFLDSRDVDPKIEEESFLSLLSSALIEAEKDCDCEVIGSWLESENVCISLCAAAPAYEPSSLLASALASGQDVGEYLGDRGVSLTDFKLINAQRRDHLTAAVNSPPKVSPRTTGTMTFQATSSEPEPTLFDHYLDFWVEELAPFTDQFTRYLVEEYAKEVAPKSLQAAIPVNLLTEADKTRLRRKLLNRAAKRANGGRNSFDKLTAKRAIESYSERLSKDSQEFFSNLINEELAKEFNANLVEYSQLLFRDESGVPLPSVKKVYYGQAYNREIDKLLYKIGRNQAWLYWDVDEAGNLIPAASGGDEALLKDANRILNKLGKRAATDPQLITRFNPLITPEAIQSIQAQVWDEYEQMVDGFLRGMDRYLAEGFDYGQALSKATQGGSWLRAIDERTAAITDRLAAETFGKAIAERNNRVAVKVWRTQRDDRVRPTHKIDGQERPLKGHFSNGINPGEEWRCRCWLDIRLKDEKLPVEDLDLGFREDVTNDIESPQPSWAAQTKENDERWQSWIVGQPRIPRIVLEGDVVDFYRLPRQP